MPFTDDVKTLLFRVQERQVEGGRYELLHYDTNQVLNFSQKPLSRKYHYVTNQQLLNYIKLHFPDIQWKWAWHHFNMNEFHIIGHTQQLIFGNQICLEVTNNYHGYSGTEIYYTFKIAPDIYIYTNVPAMYGLERRSTNPLEHLRKLPIDLTKIVKTIKDAQPLPNDDLPKLYRYKPNFIIQDGWTDLMVLANTINKWSKEKSFKQARNYIANKTDLYLRKKEQ